MAEQVTCLTLVSMEGLPTESSKSSLEMWGPNSRLSQDWGHKSAFEQASQTIVIYIQVWVRLLDTCKITQPITLKKTIKTYPECFSLWRGQQIKSKTDKEALVQACYLVHRMIKKGWKVVASIE